MLFENNFHFIVHFIITIESFKKSILVFSLITMITIAINLLFSVLHYGKKGKTKES